MPARDVMAAYLAAARAKDWDAAFGLFADDLVVHIRGRSPFAGDHRGKQAAIDELWIYEADQYLVDEELVAAVSA